MNNKLIALCMLTLVLQVVISCTSYQDELHAKLANLTPAQRHIALAQECKERLLEDAQIGNPTAADHVERMKYICEEMTGQKISLAN